MSIRSCAAFREKVRRILKKELRGLIEDMLKERCGELPREKKDLNVVLAELGAPSELAAQYRDQPTRYLIGPELFPKYWFILKIVLPVVAAGMSIAYLIVAILNPEVQWYVQLGRWLGSTIFGLTGVFAGMTLLFAIFEWRGISMEDLGEGLDLKPASGAQQKGRISRGIHRKHRVYSAGHPAVRSRAAAYERVYLFRLPPDFLTSSSCTA